MPKWEAEFWVKASGSVALIIEAENEEEAIRQAKKVEENYWDQWEEIEESFDTSWVTEFKLEKIKPYK